MRMPKAITGTPAKVENLRERETIPAIRVAVEFHRVIGH